VWAGRLTKKHAFKVLELKSVLCGQFICFIKIHYIIFEF